MDYYEMSQNAKAIAEIFWDLSLPNSAIPPRSELEIEIIEQPYAVSLPENSSKIILSIGQSGIQTTEQASAICKRLEAISHTSHNQQSDNPVTSQS